MKRLIIALSILLFVSCKTKKTVSDTVTPAPKTIKVVTTDEVDAVIVDKAFNLGTRLLETCNTSRFKAFSPDEATESVIKNSTAKKISETCKKINFRNGKFISIDLVEIIRDEIKNQHIFRYAINYEKTFFKRELTSSLDG